MRQALLQLRDHSGLRHRCRKIQGRPLQALTGGCQLHVQGRTPHALADRHLARLQRPALQL
jgi:hypothetical protein